MLTGKSLPVRSNSFFSRPAGPGTGGGQAEAVAAMAKRAGFGFTVVAGLCRD